VERNRVRRRVRAALGGPLGATPGLDVVFWVAPEFATVAFIELERRMRAAVQAAAAVVTLS
jgi:ribonuclease P protein component